MIAKAIVVTNYDKISEAQWRAERFPEKNIKKYGIPGFDDGDLKAEDMLTEDEVNGIITACKNPRDRAIVSMLASGGFRPITRVASVPGVMGWRSW